MISNNCKNFSVDGDIPPGITTSTETYYSHSLIHGTLWKGRTILDAILVTSFCILTTCNCLHSSFSQVDNHMSFERYYAMKLFIKCIFYAKKN